MQSRKVLWKETLLNLVVEDRNYSEVSFPLKYRDIFHQEKYTTKSIAVRIRPNFIGRQVIKYF
jgi:hypothetical protein